MSREDPEAPEERQALAAIFRSIHIQSPARIAFPAAVPAEPEEPLDLEREERQRLVLALRDLLYVRCFSRPGPGGRAPVPPEHPGLVQRLSAANHGRDAWIPGWRVEETGPAGRVVIARGGWRRAAGPGEYFLTFTEDLPPRVGCAATLRHRKESLTMQPGVYYAFGDALPAPGEEERALRLYFHAAQESAVPLFAFLTAGLNALGVPFTLKSMLRAEDRDRSDATLLYLPAPWFPAFAGLLRRSAASLRPCLAAGAPLFTKPLAPGLGLAESPLTGESFGMHRCRLVAEGIVDAWRDGRQDAAARWQSVESRFAADGLALARPYLNPGSDDVYRAGLP